MSLLSMLIWQLHGKHKNSVEYYGTNELFSVHPSMSSDHFNEYCINFVRVVKKNCITKTGSMRGRMVLLITYSFTHGLSPNDNGANRER